MNAASAALARHARRHHGLFRLADADRLGLSRSILERLISQGWCERPANGVYRLCGAPVTHQQALLAAVWAAPDLSVGSHRAAGGLWGSPSFKGVEPEVTAAAGQNQRLGLGTIHCSLWLPASHVTTRER